MPIPDVSRRRFLEKIGAGAVSASILPFWKDPRITRATDLIGVTDPLLGKQLYQDVVTYVDLGEHRSGTVVDRLTARWMESHLRSQGFKTETQTFSIPHDIVFDTKLVVGTTDPVRIEAFPLWPVFFSNLPILRPLVSYSVLNLPALRGKIALVSFPFSNTGIVSQPIINLIKSAAAAGAVAVVGITEGPTGMITAMNPTAGQAPWPVPVVLVGPRDQAALLNVVNSGETVSLQILGQAANAGFGMNIIGRQQRQTGAPWVVVSTPFGGWFRAGGERGPGIAIWRALSRRLALRWLVPPVGGAVNYLFLATSGHELNSLGMSAFLTSGEIAPADVRLWLHLGAWVSSYAWTNPQDGSPPQRLDTDNERFLISSGINEDSLWPLARLPGIIRQMIPVGEISTILNAGFTKALSITGRNLPHHSRMDTAICTGPEKLEPVARNIATFLTNAVATPA